MTSPKLKDILDVWEIDYLTAVKEKLQKKTAVTSARWMLMDRSHVLAAVRVGGALKSFMECPPEGWNMMSYKRLRDDNFKPGKPFPMIDRRRYDQLENMIRFYDPNFFRSKKKIEETIIVYINEEFPIIIWIEQEDLAVFIAPLVVAMPNSGGSAE